MSDKKEPWNNEKPWLPDPAQWKGTWRDDWRIRGQEGYLVGKHLYHRHFDRSICLEDYLQCEFCWDTFDNDRLHPKMAYWDGDRHWICEECYQDFKKHFKWTVEEFQE